MSTNVSDNPRILVYFKKGTLNHKSIDTVFRITSGNGATFSLSLADHFVKKKANSELCYYSTYIKRYPVVCHSCLGIKSASPFLWHDVPGFGRDVSSYFICMLIGSTLMA